MKLYSLIGSILILLLSPSFEFFLFDRLYGKLGWFTYIAKPLELPLKVLYFRVILSLFLFNLFQKCITFIFRVPITELFLTNIGYV